MKRLSILLLICSIASIAQGMDADAARRIAILESLNELSESNQMLKLWHEFNGDELVNILTIALAEKLATTGETKYGAVLSELKNPLYGIGEKTTLLSLEFKPKELIKILQKALIIKIYGNLLDDAEDMKDMKE